MDMDEFRRGVEDAHQMGWVDGYSAAKQDLPFKWWSTFLLGLNIGLVIGALLGRLLP